MRNRCEPINAIRATIITTLAVIVASFTSSSVSQPESKCTFTPQDFIVPLPTISPTFTPTPTPDPKPDELLSGLLEDVEITYIDIEYEYLGTYFITAYCPYECGYREYEDGTDNFPAGWMTASGEICHRASWEDRLLEPTTCAISRSVHSFGDLFYIEEFDRVFVAEDTGSAVNGYHLDLFYETYDEVLSFPTGYYTVYSVEYVTKTITTKEIEE